MGDEAAGEFDDLISEPDEENIALQKIEFWSLEVHVHGKQVHVSVGDATQRLKWLATVGIARWDDANNQGWKRLGIPTVVRRGRKDGDELDMNAIIRDTLQNGEHIYVTTSLGPFETR